MTTYKLELTETERAIGVTLEDVADVLERAWMPRAGRIILPAGTSPAVGNAVARCAFAGAPFDYVPRPGAAYPIYETTD